jgi:hypothetical protein
MGFIVATCLEALGSKFIAASTGMFWSCFMEAVSSRPRALVMYMYVSVWNGMHAGYVMMQYECKLKWMDGHFRCEVYCETFLSSFVSV